MKLGADIIPPLFGVEICRAMDLWGFAAALTEIMLSPLETAARTLS